MAVEMILTAMCLNITCDNATLSNGLTPPDITDHTYYYDFNETETSAVLKGFRIQKLREELNGKVLKVTSLEDFPLSWTEDVNGTLVGRGVAFNLLNILMDKYNFTYELVMPKNNIVGSTKDMEGSIIELLQTGEIDLAAAFIPILADARRHIKFSTGLDEGEYYMIMIRPAESASGSGLLAPFQETVWVLILLSLLAVGPIIYWLIKFRNRFAKDDAQKIYPLPHCIWFVYGALMKQGSTLSPSADSTRVLFATWWIFITILTSFYTANLTAFLTLSKFTLPFNEVQDIVRKQKQFVAQRGSGIEYAIKNDNEELNVMYPLVARNLVEFATTLNDTDILINKVEKRNYLYIRDRPAMDYLRYSDYKYRKTLSADNERVHCPFAVAKSPLLSRRRAFAYPTDSPWNTLFDPEFLSLVESGIVKYMLWEHLPDAEICPQQLASTERQLRNGDLMTTYYVMIAGFIASFVIFVTELFFKCVNEKILSKGKKMKKTTKIVQVKEAPTDTARIGEGMAAWATKISKLTPPPSYNSLLDRIHSNTKANINTQESYTDGGYNQVINGREYKVITESDGTRRLIPLRVPSAALFTYFTYNTPYSNNYKH